MGQYAYMSHGGVLVTLSVCDRDALIGPNATGSSLTPEMLATQYPVGAGRLVYVHPLANPRDHIAATQATLAAVLEDGVMPVEVEGTIEYIVSETEDAWLVTLINNEGVLKHPFEPEGTLVAFDRTVSLTWKTAGAGSASELRSGCNLCVTLDATSDETIATTSLTVLAGDVSVARLER